MKNIYKNRDYKPMLLKEISKPFDSKDYFFEIKFDGIRALVFASPKHVSIQTRNKQDITNLFPELQEIKKLVTKEVVFDGEITAFYNNLPSFSHLQERTHLKNPVKIKAQSQENPITYIVFDILYEGKDLTNLPLTTRKMILDNYSNNDVFIKSKIISEYGKDLFKSIKKLGLEGIVAKKKDSPYLIDERSANWLKIKNLKEDNFYIGGYTDTNKNESITIYLGEKIKNKLFYVGKVSMAKKHELFKKIIQSKKRETSPFTDYNDAINYITPKFQCHVKYLERTKSNHLRQPIFKGEVKNKE